MIWPAPRAGSLIRYAYLWRSEQRRGLEEGLKDRPCAVLLAATRSGGLTRVAVVPVTHTPPGDPSEAVEIPHPTRRRLGLDDQRSWIVLTEGNSFFWPGPDLRPLPGQGTQSVVMGDLPAAFFRIVRDRFVALYHGRKAALVERTD